MLLLRTAIIGNDGVVYQQRYRRINAETNGTYQSCRCAADSVGEIIQWPAQPLNVSVY
jgi:hypothetical protein